jgi:pSer/pThr/pTyr-binding forkhead associated (FHA) protein
MIKCSFCHASHVYNTVFCDECGHFLVEGGSTSTEKFPPSDGEVTPTKWRNPRATIQIITKPETPVTGELPELSTNGGASSNSKPIICLTIGPEKRKMRFQFEKPVNLGRIDPGKDIFPDIDLSADDPTSKVISRRHARLFIRKNVLMVEDLESTNGTFVNGERLPPYLPTILSNGDHLKLGTLKVEIWLHPPQQ